MHNNLSGPMKAVCYRGVYTIKGGGGVCYKSFLCTHMYSQTSLQHYYWFCNAVNGSLL